MITYNVNGLDVGFGVKNDRVETFFCVGEEENIGEMLSQAAAALYNFAGVENVSYWYPNLLDQLLNARAGTETEKAPFIEGVCIFQLYRNKKQYFFILSVIGG